MMKYTKRWIMAGVAAAIIGVSGFTAMAAADYTNPMQLVANITGRTVESVADEQYTTGKSLYTIADEAGKSADFKDGMVTLRKERLDQCVADGTMSRDRADVIVSNMKANDSGYGYGCGGGGYGPGCGGYGGRGNY